MIDANTVTVGYDAARGEPRAKAKAHGPLPDDGTMSKGAGPENAGDCVDCKRCVVVCPTGIDIRNGLQIDCVACTACIDACDEIMDRLHRPRGLVRYASAAALAGDKTRWIRSRTVVYTALLGAGAVAAVIAFGKHEDFEANLLRLPGPPYTLDGDSVRDGFEVHLVNKTGQQKTYTIAGETDVPEASLVVALPRVEVAAMQGTRVPILISLPRSAFLHDFGVRVRVRPVDEEAHERVLSGQFLGARSGG
jgi:cytochrome c oxidase accessory protein FixG